MTTAIDLPELAGLALVVAVAGLLRGFTGFGAGLLMVPALGLILGPQAAVAVAVLLDAAVGVLLVPKAVRQARWAIVAPLAVAAVVTIPLGSIVLVTIAPETMRRAISVVVLCMVAILASGWRYRRTPSLAISAATGATSGLLTGMAGIGGPPVILFFLSGVDPAPRTRASLICHIAITQTVALIAFAFAGLLLPGVLVRAVVLLPIFLLSTHLGARAFRRSGERSFRAVALGLLAVVATLGLIL